MNTKIINLEEYRTPKAKVFSGRPRGKEVREKSGIDELVNKFDKIEIIIPDDIYAINPSFLEEFLLNVVTMLKEEDFYKKFDFSSKGEYEIADDLQEAVSRILKKYNALA
ncbi:MAG: DUF4325 domain-containing protein [Thermonemataceae bacterium]|nr:DUF4325 domain-containing protein [Thermonemataceae bacterium]